MSDDAIPAATVILVRERDGSAPELLMVVRAVDMAFAGGAWVFPGGRIDEADRRIDNSDDGARVAAVRESLEETAIPVGLSPVPSPDLSAELQMQLLGGSELDEVLLPHDLKLDLGALVPFARWVPKFHAKRRFDTLFFVARAPDGEWIPNTVESECTGAYWVTAAEALERDRSGEIQLIFPTRRTLERLAQHASFDAIVGDAKAHTIEPITPWLDEIGGERFIAIPEGIGYPVTREKIDGLWRG